MRKTALITGVTGQDGSYLAELLLEKGYEVHGIKRRASSLNTSRVDHLYESPESKNRNFFLHYGDLSDSLNLTRLMQKIQPDEVYNLAAQSHVAVSFETPEYTATINALGPLRLLEAIRINGLNEKTKFYQASTSELFGWSTSHYQNEQTPFYPKSPYGSSKLFGHWITINYREAFGMYACCGLLFNHESPRRGETFVSKKITSALTKIFTGKQQFLELGNLNALRDWGHAKDYVEMQWLMLQQKQPEDFIIATGIQHSVRTFVEKACAVLGIQISWQGKGLDEVGIIKHIHENEHSNFNFLKKGDVIVRINPRYFRPLEVDTLLGDSKLAKEKLGWNPRLTFDELVQEMVLGDLATQRN